MRRLDEIRVIARTDIYQIISEHIELTPSQGKDYYGDCPFCKKHQSLAIAPSKGLFYCFGCQKGGDPVLFLQLVTGKSTLQILQELSDRYFD